MFEDDQTKLHGRNYGQTNNPKSLDQTGAQNTQHSNSQYDAVVNRSADDSTDSGTNDDVTSTSPTATERHRSPATAVRRRVPRQRHRHGLRRRNGPRTRLHGRLSSRHDSLLPAPQPRSTDTQNTSNCRHKNTQNNLSKAGGYGRNIQQNQYNTDNPHRVQPVHLAK